MRDEQGGAGTTGGYSGIGGSGSSSHPAGEVLFLDEPADYARHARVPEPASAREFFADEDAIAGASPAGAAAAPALRFNLLTMSFLVVATAAFATAQSCQADAMTPGRHTTTAAPSGAGPGRSLP